MPLTPDQKVAAENAFGIYGGPKGYLTQTEFGKALGALGFTPTLGDLKTLAGEKSSLEQYLGVANKLDLPTQRDNDDLLDAWRVFDKLQSGLIPAKEFVNFTKVLGEKFNDVEAAHLLTHAKDGKFRYEEMVKAMSK